MPNIHISTDPEQLAHDFARYFADWANRQTRPATVALSGGSTPRRLFEILAEEYATAINWSALLFFWGDDRCVPPDDEESNFKMANDLLLSKVGVPDANIFRVRGEDEPESEAMRYAEVIDINVRLENGLPAFDLALQGMGEDGHTASIFPHQMDLLDSPAICAVAEHPDSGQKRITITGPVIRNAKHIAFLVAGEKKAVKVAAILKKTPESQTYPSAHIHADNGVLSWHLDQAAATLFQR